MKRDRPEKLEPPRPTDEAHWLRRAANAGRTAAEFRALADEQYRLWKERSLVGSVGPANMHGAAHDGFRSQAKEWDAIQAKHEATARQAALNDAADAAGIAIPSIHDCAHGIFCPHNGEAGDG